MDVDGEAEGSEEQCEEQTDIDGRWAEIHTGQILIDEQTGAIIQANDAALDLCRTGSGAKRLEQICREIVKADRKSKNTAAKGELAESGPSSAASTIAEGRTFFRSIMPCSLGGRRYLFASLFDVTDCQEVEQSLCESEEKFRSLFEQSPDAVYCVDTDGRFMTANTKLLSVSGYSMGELRRMTFDGFIAPEDRSRIWEHFRKALKGESQRYEVECHGKYGTTFHVQVTDIPMVVNGRIHGVYGVARDVTELKRTLRDLRESEEKYRQLFDMESDAIFLIDNGTGAILEGNDSATALYGYGREEFLKMKHAELSAEPAKTADATLTNQDRVLLGYHRKKDGTVFPCEIAARHFLRNGRPVHIAAIRDISDRKKKEDEALQSYAKLRTAMGAIIQAVSSMTEARDPYTSGHQRRVANLARCIAKEMGLSQDSIDAIRTAGAIHDIGKISVPAEILSKPSKLTEPEFGLIRNHPLTAYNILKDIEFPWPIAEIIYQHHERMNGSGYPRALKGEAILMEARVIAVADVVEAIASHRPYRPANGIEAAMEEIEAKKGILYDERVAEACLKIFHEKRFQFIFVVDDPGR